jgi:hypothetical protein
MGFKSEFKKTTFFANFAKTRLLQTLRRISLEIKAEKY